MRTAGIIGAGFSGLSAACCLAKEGFDVTIYEKNSIAGGRARKFEADGFTFDMGPSWYWMPDVFEKFFNLFDKTTSDFYELKRLDPSYRIYYDRADYIDIPADREALSTLFESLEPGSSLALEKFLNEGKFKYDLGINELVYKPGLSVRELMAPKVLNGVFKMHVFQSIATYIRKFFKHPRIIQLLEFPVLFLGGTPQSTPALYSLMNYADMCLGTWYPMGGMFRIIEAMESVARSLGVDIRYDTPIDHITVEGDSISAMKSGDHTCVHDAYVASADYHHVEQQLLPREYRRYTHEYWNTRTMAPSSLLFYLGVNKRISGLRHHTLFFDQDFGQHAREIYDNPRWPTAPQFYVSCPTKTDSTVAPEGHENLLILIPVAPGLPDSEEIRGHYYDIVMGRLESMLGESIKDHVVFKRSYAHRDFEQDYNAFKGNAYGLANTLWQTANLKPSIVNNKVTNLFYTGQLTVPGPGVPPSLISGQVVARQVAKTIDVTLTPA